MGNPHTDLLYNNLSERARETFDVVLPSILESGEANLLLNGLQIHASGTLISAIDLNSDDRTPHRLAGAVAPEMLAAILSLLTPVQGARAVFHDDDPDRAIQGHLKRVAEADK